MASATATAQDARLERLDPQAPAEPCAQPQSPSHRNFAQGQHQSCNRSCRPRKERRKIVSQRSLNELRIEHACLIINELALIFLAKLHRPERRHFLLQKFSRYSRAIFRLNPNPFPALAAQEAVQRSLAP